MAVIDVSREDIGRRAGPDVERHRFLARRELRDRMRGLIAEISVIGLGSGSRRFKIQVPVLKEHVFEYSHRREYVGYVDSEVNPERGDKVYGPPRPQRGPGGSGDGDDLAYEMHVDLDDIREFLFADLELPNFLRQQLRRIRVEEKGGLVGVTRRGLMARLNRRMSVRQRSRRVQGQQREGADTLDGFVEDDLRFRRLSKRTREVSNAVCIFMMDISGSMGVQQKYLCRAFFWLLDAFVRTKYEQVEVVYIVHHAQAEEVAQEQFFHTTESGGTVCSTAYTLALDVIAERFSPDLWNVYAFHMSDGDNWMDDNAAACGRAEELCHVCNLFGYGQVSGWNSDGFDENEVRWSTMFQVLEPLRARYSNMSLVRLRNKDDIYPQFRQMLEGEKVKGGV